MKLPRMMTAAPKSGSGKTMITCGLLAWMKGRGTDVRAYKCGPDYIDPMFHRRVLGVPGGNLDTFFSDADEIRRGLASGGSEAAVIEGVMGIYDGVTGLSGKGSCYDVAAASGTPVVLIIDVRGMGQTMLSLIKGILLDDTKCLIRGIVLNRISERYLEEMRPMIEEMLAEISQSRGVSIGLIGGIPNVKGMKIESRHLGLMMPEEIEDLNAQVEAAKRLIEDHLDTEALLGIMEQAAELPDAAYRTEQSEKTQSEKAARSAEQAEERPVLAVARDEAFCFYYEENIRALEEAGIRIEEFSPLHDGGLPQDADGILLGGGYPELHAAGLSSNAEMRRQIREAVERGMPCLAECGGFMYLLDELGNDAGTRYPMCGVIEGCSHNTGRLGRFGYVTVSGQDESGNGSGERAPVSLLSGLSVRGHEFHYFDSDNNGSDAAAVKPGSGRSWECMHAKENLLAGYPHLWYRSCPELVERFRSAMSEYRRCRSIIRRGDREPSTVSAGISGDQ